MSVPYHKPCNRHTTADILGLKKKKIEKKIVFQLLLFNYPALVKLHFWCFIFKGTKWVLQITHLTNTWSTQKKEIPSSSKSNFLLCCWILWRMWSICHCASQEVLLNLCRRQALSEIVVVEKFALVIFGIAHT